MRYARQCTHKEAQSRGVTNDFYQGEAVLEGMNKSLWGTGQRVANSNGGGEDFTEEDLSPRWRRYFGHVQAARFAAWSLSVRCQGKAEEESERLTQHRGRCLDCQSK
jgi:hypothetical protein